MDVTIGDARFDRYYRRLQLGLRQLSHGARPMTASIWSGFTLDQLVTLRQRWLPEVEASFRGPCPTSFQPFFRSAAKASHAALFVSLHRIVGVDSCEPSLEGGEGLCEAYEIFREWEPESTLEFDEAVLLAMGAVKGEAIELTSCVGCACALLVDKLNVPKLTCARCRN